MLLNAEYSKHFSTLFTYCNEYTFLKKFNNINFNTKPIIQIVPTVIPKKIIK